MEIIPVIDVRMGRAVRAVAGDRASYRPLETPVSASADPLAVAAGYCALFPFTTLYVADLDGIEGRGADRALQAQLTASWGGTSVWIDDGAPASNTPPPRGEVLGVGGRFAMDVTRVPQTAGSADGSCHRITGSESLTNWPRAPFDPGAILSLDFRGEEFVGPSSLLEQASHWPQRLIVMTLARVGTDGGPDFARVSDIVRRAGTGRKVYAAGGVRDTADLRLLRDLGAAGALVASALHAGKIKTGDLEEIAG